MGNIYHRVRHRRKEQIVEASKAFLDMAGLNEDERAAWSWAFPRFYATQGAGFTGIDFNSLGSRPTSYRGYATFVRLWEILKAKKRVTITPEYGENKFQRAKGTK